MTGKNGGKCFLDKCFPSQKDFSFFFVQYEFVAIEILDILQNTLIKPIAEGEQFDISYWRRISADGLSGC